MTQDQQDPIVTELASPLNPVVAELFSFDKRFLLRINFEGYQFPKQTKHPCDSDWYRVTIEYRGPRELYRKETCEYDAWSFILAPRSIETFRGFNETDQILLAPPYGANKFTLEYRKGYLKKRARPFPRSRQGIFVSARLENFTFSFKVYLTSLWKFSKEIEAATRLLPIRDIERARKLGRI